jgi:serpin B
MTAGQLEAFFAGVALPVVEGEGIRIWLPKFKIEYKKLLNDALVALGMGPAFELGGFDGIAEGLGISRVIHQTFVEVDEKGTEAAAATAVEVFSGISPDFIGNKPFFFVIRDDRTGTILFMGKVADPKAG